MKYTTLILDFDYTIADSSNGAVECINYALNKLGFPKPEKQIACRTIGFSLEKTFLTLTGSNNIQKQQDFKHLFLEKADQVVVVNTFIYDEAEKFICSMSANGIKLGIVSTKFRHRIEQILLREGLLDYFDLIIGGGDVKKNKPDPEGLLRSIEILNSKHGNVLYIGDSITDAETANNAKVDFVAITSGTTEFEEFKTYQPIAIFDNLNQLKIEVEKNFS